MNGLQLSDLTLVKYNLLKQKIKRKWLCPVPVIIQLKTIQKSVNHSQVTVSQVLIYQKLTVLMTLQLLLGINQLEQ